jgi:DNA-binding transcriptional MerR regulator
MTVQHRQQAPCHEPTPPPGEGRQAQRNHTTSPAVGGEEFGRRPLDRPSPEKPVRGRALRTGEVARLAGLNVQTLRYYERRGLLPRPERTPGGHRAYPPDAVTLLRTIKDAQRLGFTLEEIATLLAPNRHRPGLGRQAAEKLAEINVRIEELMSARTTLTALIAAGCDDLANCSSAACPRLSG